MRMTYLVAAFAVACSSVSASVSAQELDCDQLLVVVPFSAGGATDVVTRLVGEGLEERLGTNVVIEARPGAGGNVGTRSVVEAEPDGCTVVVNGNQLASMTAAYSDLGFDPLKDLVAVGNVGLSPTMIVSSLPELNNLKDMVDLGRQRTVSYGTPGVGLLQHLSMEQIEHMSGVDLNHVPYRGGSQALADLTSGRLDVGAFAAGTVVPAIRDGRLKLLAPAQAKRTSFAPDVPSAAEQGFEGLNGGIYFLMFAPAGTPEETVQTLSNALAETVSDPELKQRFDEIGFEPIAMNPEESAELMRQSAEDWTPVIGRLGIRLD